MSNYIDSKTVEDNAGNHNNEPPALKDDNYVNSETGQFNTETGSPRHKGDAGHKMSRWTENKATNVSLDRKQSNNKLRLEQLP